MYVHSVDIIFYNLFVKKKKKKAFYLLSDFHGNNFI